MINEFKPDNLNEELTYILCNIVEMSGINVMSKFNNCQKLLMKWVDLSVETSKFSMKKEERTSEIEKLEGTKALILEEIEKRDKLLERIIDSLNEQPKLGQSILEKIQIFEEKRQGVVSMLKKCKDLGENLNFVFQKLSEIVSPFSKKKEEALKIIDAFCVWIIIWNKYPYDIKRNMI